MQKTLVTNFPSRQETQLKAAIKECDAAIVRVFKRIKKDQQAIDRLKKETRAMLDALKAA